MKAPSCLCAALFGLLTFSAQAAIDVHDPYARATPPRAPNSAAFMVLTNSGNEAINLISAASPAAGKVELHNHVMADGMMKMRQVETIVIPSQGKATLEPGGFHIMLLDLTAPLKEGEALSLTLRFSDGTEITQSLPIRKTMVESKMKHSHDNG
ncbi:copper chaperone PCu(A)C [Enterovibrio sp. 27052020O]|uniref:copper chaperone PCu(A)C n=1 Tax=Enterovibrio sp. 27052020O TaxID=3241166 RepID=UPI00388CFA06